MAEGKKATDLSDILGADFDKLLTKPVRRATSAPIEPVVEAPTLNDLSPTDATPTMIDMEPFTTEDTLPEAKTEPLISEKTTLEMDLPQERTMELDISSAIEELPDQDEDTASNLSQEQAEALMPDLSTLLSNEEMETAPTVKMQIDIDQMLNASKLQEDLRAQDQGPFDVEVLAQENTVKEEEPAESIDNIDAALQDDIAEVAQMASGETATAATEIQEREAAAAQEESTVSNPEAEEKTEEKDAAAKAEEAAPAIDESVPMDSGETSPLAAPLPKEPTSTAIITRPQIMPLITDKGRPDNKIALLLLTILLLIVTLGWLLSYNAISDKNKELSGTISTLTTPMLFEGCGKSSPDDTTAACKYRTQLQLTRCIKVCNYSNYTAACTESCQDLAKRCEEGCLAIVPPPPPPPPPCICDSSSDQADQEGPAAAEEETEQEEAAPAVTEKAPAKEVKAAKTPVKGKSGKSSVKGKSGKSSKNTSKNGKKHK